MKREIIFRGLRTDGKGWVIGSLILPNTENSNTYIQDGNGVCKRVCKESVGQFTGLTDKNGVEIYEGDKLSDGKLIYVVEYNTQNTKYCINPIWRVTKEDIDIVEFLSYDQLGSGYYSRKDLEVIGNIHEEN